MRRIHGADSVRVFSVEQGEDAAAQTRARLEALGLNIRSASSPLERVQVDALESSGYAVTVDQMGAFLGDVARDGAHRRSVGGYGAVLDPSGGMRGLQKTLRSGWMMPSTKARHRPRREALAISHRPRCITAKASFMDVAVLHTLHAVSAAGWVRLDGPAEYVLFKMPSSVLERSTGLKLPFQQASSSVMA